ncbi:Rv1476 family membrane protein [Gordonia aurantiaca]|uniref:Rv1476 family membrane protein n=1 Tax=Gordonia sp. B21 TaxID=3151852 RepID=UPI00326406A6
MGPESTVVLAAPAENKELAGLVGVDMDQLARDIADDGVAGASPEQVPAMLEVVEYAKSKGHDFSFVVIQQQQPRFTLYRDIANQLQEQVGGTVIVLGPNSVGSSSPEISRVIQEQATQDLSLTDPPGAARQMVDVMTDDHIDWTVVGLVLILVVVLGAVAARIRTRRARAAAANGPLGPVVDRDAPDSSDATPVASGERTADSSAS